MDKIPYRVVLTTWMDQMQLSRLVAGSCIGFSIEPNYNFEDRCGMATSTRRTIKKIWGGDLPGRNPIELAKLAFAVENMPELPVEVSDDFPWGGYAPKYITGAIDPITVLVPGISRCYYGGKPWPSELETIYDEETFRWLESIITLEPTSSRPDGESFNLDIKIDYIRNLADFSEKVWNSIRKKDTGELVEAVNGCRDAIGCLSSSYLANGVREKVDFLHSKGVLASFPQGAGCGGYIACISESAGERIKIKIRRK